MIKATAKDEIQVVLQEYLGNRKAAKVAETVYAVIQKETQHTHNGKKFLSMKILMEHLCLQWSLW